MLYPLSYKRQLPQVRDVVVVNIPILVIRELHNQTHEFVQL